MVLIYKYLVKAQVFTSFDLISYFYELVSFLSEILFFQHALKAINGLNHYAVDKDLRENVATWFGLSHAEKTRGIPEDIGVFDKIKGLHL